MAAKCKPNLSPAQIARCLEIRSDIQMITESCDVCTARTKCHKHRRAVATMRREISFMLRGWK